jgi:hypothetical protein
MRTPDQDPRRPGRVPRLVAFALLAAAAACDSRGSGGGASPFGAASQYAARCQVPRTGVDPQTGGPYLDRPGSVADEKAWLRAWIDQYYLWYREVPSPDPAASPTPVAYFDLLKTSALTASGRPKDRFHFSMPTADWVALSQSGVDVGYGVQWVILARSPPRRIVAVAVLPGTSAAAAGLGRGAEVVTVDGAAVLDGDPAILNAGLFPAAAGETHRLEVTDTLGVTRTVSVTSAAISSPSVQDVQVLATATGPVGYLLFNDHLAPAEAQLLAAVQQLRTAAVTDLILDLRYNGGGYLDVASEAAFMIAGPARTAGRIFERAIFNDKAGALDPLSGRPNLPTPFFATALGISSPSGTPLPTLGLGRVFVLTGAGTCSASESVMNGLRGVGVEVIQVGATTCGKPFAFYPEDNCGVTYFAIQLQGVNQQGFGDYGDGFVPGGPGANGLPGCAVADDYLHALGDPAEARLAAALAYRATGACPPAAIATARAAQRPTPSEGELVRSPWRESRILTR